MSSDFFFWGSSKLSSCRTFWVSKFSIYIYSFHVTAADIFLWRNKKVSAGVLGVATVIWILFELVEYHLLTLVCHLLILALALLFLWSNASTFINKYVSKLLIYCHVYWESVSKLLSYCHVHCFPHSFRGLFDTPIISV